jgi:hypothetical protein
MIGILREQEGWGEDGRRFPQTRGQQRYLLQVEGQIWRARRVGRQASEATPALSR